MRAGLHSRVSAFAVCNLALIGNLFLSEVAAAQVRLDGNEIPVPLRETSPIRGSANTPEVVTFGDFAPAGQRLVYTQTGFPLCSGFVSVLTGTFPAPTPVLVASAVQVPRGSSVMEISFDGITRLRSTTGQGQAQIGGLLRVRESAGPGPWVVSVFNLANSHSGIGGLAPSSTNFTMWAPLSLDAYVAVMPGVAYDVEAVAYYSAASPDSYLANRADVCNGRLVVRM